MFEAIQEYIRRGKECIIEYVLWAERELKGRPGAEKKAAVVQKLDDMISLPGWLEWADGPIIAWLVNRACDTLNYLYGHIWPEKWEREDIEKTAAAIPDPDQMKRGGENANDGDKAD